MKFTEKQLKEGSEFVFESWSGEDDFRIATISFKDFGSRNSWATGFKIEFNGKFIHSSKTFKSLQKKFTELCEKWDLKFTEINQ